MQGGPAAVMSSARYLLLDFVLICLLKHGTYCENCQGYLAVSLHFFISGVIAIVLSKFGKISLVNPLGHYIFTKLSDVLSIISDKLDIQPYSWKHTEGTTLDWPWINLEKNNLACPLNQSSLNLLRMFVGVMSLQG